MSEKKLVRSNDRMISGVCGGIAEYLNIDPVIVRFIFALATLMSFGWGGVIAYVILALVMPDANQETDARFNAFDEEEIIVKDS